MSAREKLLNAAAKLAATDGVQGLGVERVVQEAEVSKGAFFYHFETKEQMIGALLDHVASQRMAEVDAAVRSGRSFAGALVDMVESELLESGQLVGVLVAAVLLDSSLRRTLTARQADWRKRLIKEDGFSLERADQLLLTIDGAMIGQMLYDRKLRLKRAKACMRIIRSLVPA